VISATAGHERHYLPSTSTSQNDRPRSPTRQQPPENSTSCQSPSHQDSLCGVDMECGLVEPSGPVEQRPGEIAIGQARPDVGEYQAPTIRAVCTTHGSAPTKCPLPHWAARMPANHGAVDRCRSGYHALRPQRHEGWDASLPARPEARSRPVGVRRIGSLRDQPRRAARRAAPNAARGVKPTAPTA
jgi:hypothetical protein